jgi:ABC-type transport system involved in multi-copper enzyme maturation permease subunit
MGQVIYSASLFQAFIWSFVTILLVSTLGVLGLGLSVVRRGEKTFVRMAMGCAGIFLCVVGAALALIVYRSMTIGAKTITAHLNDKQIAHDNCGDNSTCTRYVLEMQAEKKFYDLNVTEAAYEKAQVDSCYVVTYYPSKGLFSEPSYADSYETISTITHIETARCP